MSRPQRSSRSPWGSLNLRLVLVFVALLVGTATGVGYLLDRGRGEALAERDRAQLRLEGELVAGAVTLWLRQLVGDLQLLAQMLPAAEIRPTPSGAAPDASAESTRREWGARVQQVLHTFAGSRPELLDVRLHELRDDAPGELVGVERGPGGLAGLASQVGYEAVVGLDLRAASRARPGVVSLAWQQLATDGEGTERPSGLILAATTPVQGADGTLAGVLLARVDLVPTIEAARSTLGRAATLSIIDERGDPLLAFGSSPSLDLGRTAVASVLPGAQGGAFSQVPGVDGAYLAYVTARSWDPGDPDRRLIFALSEPEPKPQGALDLLRRESLLAALGLVVLAILVVGVLLRRQTRPLSALAGASEAIARGDFSMELPPADSSEVGSLVRAFRHMAEEVERREAQLAALNLDLEHRVEARTAELAHEHALQRLILDSVADGVVVVDLDGRFVLWNRKAEQIVGSGPEAVPSERWSEHFGVYRDEAGEPVPMEELPLVRAIHGKSTDNMEVYLCRPKRSEGRWAQVTARPLRGQDGGLSGAVAVLVDVTEKRRMEARLHAHRAELARFGRLVLGAEIASVTAHQLSQPLAALANYVGAALRLHQQGRLREPELGEMLERIERLSVQAGAILDRLRARIRRGESPPKAFDVDAVVTSCLDFLGDRIQREGVRVQRRREASLPAVRGDPLQLEHALIQLVANALEAMETIDRGQRQLTVGTHHDARTGMLTIEIGDTGPGVSAALADRLFRPWETDKPGALGIGLTIVESIIESFGGSIRMETGIPRGARFYIALPGVPRGAA